MWSKKCFGLKIISLYLSVASNSYLNFCSIKINHTLVASFLISCRLNLFVVPKLRSIQSTFVKSVHFSIISSVPGIWYSLMHVRSATLDIFETFLLKYSKNDYHSMTIWVKLKQNSYHRCTFPNISYPYTDSYVNLPLCSSKTRSILFCTCYWISWFWANSYKQYESVVDDVSNPAAKKIISGAKSRFLFSFIGFNHCFPFVV